MGLYVQGGRKISGMYMADGHGGSKKIGGMYYANGQGNVKKIFQSTLPVGTMLWNEKKAFTDSGFTRINKNLLKDQVVKLPYPIAMLKNGLKISVSKWLYFFNGGENPYWKTGPLNTTYPSPSIVKYYIKLNPSGNALVSKSDLLTGSEVTVFKMSTLSDSGSMTDSGTLSIKLVDDYTIQFISHSNDIYRNGQSYYSLRNSTAFEIDQETYDGWIIIDSIESY